MTLIEGNQRVITAYYRIAIVFLFVVMLTHVVFGAVLIVRGSISSSSAALLAQLTSTPFDANQWIWLTSPVMTALSSPGEQ